MKTHVYKFANYSTNLDTDMIGRINILLSKGWQLENIKYDEINDQLTFRYKREITEQ